MDKYQMIDYLLVKVDEAADAHGVNRCVLSIDIVQHLNALRDLLKGEDQYDESSAE